MRAVSCLAEEESLLIRVPIPFSYCRGWSGAAVIGIAPVIGPGGEGRGKLQVHSV